MMRLIVTKTVHSPAIAYSFGSRSASRQSLSNRRGKAYVPHISSPNSPILTRVGASQEQWAQNDLRRPLDDQYILSLIFKQKKQVLIASASLIFCVCSNLASPVLSGLLFETLVMKQPFSKYGSLLGMMVLLYVMEPILSRVYILNACAIGETVQASLRKEAFRVLLMQRIYFFDKYRPSEITSILSKDLDSLRNFFFNNCSRDRGFRALFEALGSVIVLFVLSWRLGPILAGVIVATAAIAWVYRQQSKLLERDSSEAQARMAMAIDETVSQIRTVRVFAGEALERERFGTYVSDAYINGMGFAKAKALLECLNRGAIHFSLLALYGLGGYLVNAELMPIGTLLSAIGFTFSLVFATQGLLQTWTDARHTRSSLKRAQKILSEVSTDPSMADALPPGAWWEIANQSSKELNEETTDMTISNSSTITAHDAALIGDLVLNNVCFRYPARPDVQVLNNLSMTIPCGKVTALVGRSGAGKSTIAALLERLYAQNSGEVTLSGIPTTSFPRREWVEAVTAVTQEPVLFNASIYDNIAYGVPNTTAEQVKEAAIAANAHEFILRLPEGYDSIVGDQGSLLSGGQRQRIALARALLRDAPILVLDEATSALDGESESLVQQAIETLMKGRTVLIIAHRLATVQAADQIVVIDDGKVIETGTHAELRKIPNGKYSSLVSSQSLSLTNQ